MVDTTELQPTTFGPTGIIKEDGHVMKITIEDLDSDFTTYHHLSCSCGYHGSEKTGGEYQAYPDLDATHARLLNTAYQWYKPYAGD